MSKLATEVYFDLNDGNKIPALGLGTWTPDNKHTVKDWVLTAVRAGYRHLDTAWYYGTEKYIGEALKELFENGEVKREELFITTKVWPSYHHNPEKSLDESLSHLGLDYVDLLLQHWPICLAGGPDGLPTDPKDKDGNLLFDDDPLNGDGFIKFYNTLEDIKSNTNKVKSVGVSNYSLPRLKKLLPRVKKYVPVINQIEYHCQLPQKDLTDYATEHGIITEAYSPVGSDGAPVLKLPYIQELAEKYGVTTNEIANSYHIVQGRVPLPRSSNLERIKACTHYVELTEDELSKLYSIGQKEPKRYVVDAWGDSIGFKWWNSGES